MEIAAMSESKNDETHDLIKDWISHAQACKQINQDAVNETGSFLDPQAFGVNIHGFPGHVTPSAPAGTYVYVPDDWHPAPQGSFTLSAIMMFN
jgi:hypothetical protein